ncbi:hypothetical protein B0O99DRAFT_462832, partial [Bisporella sp. PMI_857]
RRPLRKGTHSCLECKRRKTRCFFLSRGDMKCVSCQRRGIACRGQELSPESADSTIASGTQDDEIAQRLERFESLLNMMIDRVMSRESANLEPQMSQEKGTEAMAGGIGLTTQSRRSIIENSYSTAGHIANSQSAPGTTAYFDQPSLTIEAPIISTDHTQLVFPSRGGSANIRQTLHAALPSQRDADVIIGAGRAFVFLQITCNPSVEIFWPGNPQPASVIAALPNVSDHPTLLARALLRLASSIQQFDPSFDCSQLRLSEPPRKAMDRYFQLARSLVTSSNQVIDSLEGLECLILECLYLVNLGNLRQAMLHVRRCLTLAQLLGLHLPNPTLALPSALDPNTRVSGAVCWDRIVCIERYVALLLGVPTAIPVVGDGTNIVEANNASIRRSPAEKLDLFHAAIAGQIIQRNQNRDEHEMAATAEIDAGFERIAKTLSPSWWAPPNFMELVRDVANSPDRLMADVLRSQAQIIHYNFRAVLHLPYLLSNTLARSFDRSKTICVSSCREVLSRFISFRSFMRVVYCCRFVDFCAFTASLALLLAHLSNHQSRTSEFRLGSFENTLALQRLEDRALLERALATMDQLDLVNNDPVSHQTALLARSLLSVESEAAAGKSTYNTHAVADPHTNNEALNTPAGLNIKIPYFGTVHVAQEISTQMLPSPILLQSGQSRPSTSLPCSDNTTTPASGANSSSNRSPFPSQMESDLLQPFGPQGNHASLPSEQTYDSANKQEQWLYANEPFKSSINGDPQEVQEPEKVDTLDSVLEWAFQGVDDMFFNSLL